MSNGGRGGGEFAAELVFGDRGVAEGLVGIQWEEDVHYSLEGRKVDFARLALAMYMGAYGMVVFSEWDEGGLPS